MKSFKLQNIKIWGLNIFLDEGMTDDIVEKSIALRNSFMQLEKT